jgi:hypothetical protein
MRDLECSQHALHPGGRQAVRFRGGGRVFDVEVQDQRAAGSEDALYFA